MLFPTINILIYVVSVESKILPGVKEIFKAVPD